jgi:CheY-like chemotaxis protein/HPt (histidine-containing phosphotransfer) domain-containing protein
VEGFQVDIALDGLAGLEMLRKFRPDAVILDLMLPKMTGVEVMKQIRSEPDFKNLPVIVFSNTYLTNLVQEAWKAGATKCLSKSNCTPKQLIEMVRSALGLNGATATGRPDSGSSGSSVERGHAPDGAHAPDARHGAARTGDPDAEFQAGLRQSFAEELPSLLAQLRGLLQGMIKADSGPERLKHLSEMYRRMRGLTGNAGVAGMSRIARMSDALEALLKELSERPDTINASVLRTVASAIDFLGTLSERGLRAEDPGAAPPVVLVVDDEAISRRAVNYALEKARLKSVSVEDPAAAYDLLVANHYDLIFLDVDMPGMNGFELCTRLRQLPAHKHTPVIFVTVLADFGTRTESAMSGGNDLIAKPFLFLELSVKALVQVLRTRLPPSKPEGD